MRPDCDEECAVGEARGGGDVPEDIGRPTASNAVRVGGADDCSQRTTHMQVVHEGVLYWTWYRDRSGRRAARPVDNGAVSSKCEGVGGVVQAGGDARVWWAKPFRTLFRHLDRVPDVRWEPCQSQLRHPKTTEA